MFLTLFFLVASSSAAPRVVTYVENWGWGSTLPSAAQLEQTTDVVVGFAVSYTGKTSSCAQNKCRFGADPITWSSPLANTLSKSVAYLKNPGGSPGPAPASANYCGKTWAAANGKCQTKCATNAECTEPGESCFAGCTGCPHPTSGVNSSMRTTHTRTHANATRSRNVILSFGGWGMGHCTTTDFRSCPDATTGPTQTGDGYNCWEPCYADPVGTARAMVAYARGNGFDGLELDYEVFGDSLKPVEHDFLVALVGEARKQWPAGVISLSTMEWPIEDTRPPPAKTYNTMLGAVAGDIDFVSVQFYNHGPTPLDDKNGVLVSEVGTVVQALGGGSVAAAKVVVGLITDAVDGNGRDNNFVPTAKGACGVVKPLVSKYKEAFGGIMQWQVKSDKDGTWLAGVAGCLSPSAGTT